MIREKKICICSRKDKSLKCLKKIRKGLFRRLKYGLVEKCSKRNYIKKKLVLNLKKLFLRSREIAFKVSISNLIGFSECFHIFQKIFV